MSVQHNTEHTTVEAKGEGFVEVGPLGPPYPIDSRINGANGFPATIGVRPVAATTAPTRVPLPGAMPRAVGMLVSAYLRGA